MDHYKNPRNKGVVEEDSVTIDMNNPTCGDRHSSYTTSGRWHCTRCEI